MNDGIIWLANWFSQYCNGDWEHENMIKIQTVDNPGWSVSISLINTEMENVDIDLQTFEVGENDWFLYKIKDGQFFAAGDLSKLPVLLGKFKELVEMNEMD